MPTEVTPELLADYESPVSIDLSPSSSHVVYALRPFWVRRHKEDSVTASIWTAEVGKENSARQVTSGRFCDNNPKFSPDGKRVSFVSDLATPGKGGALYLLPFDGPGEGLPVTEVANEKGVGQYKWSPDGTRIAFASADERSEEKRKRDEEKDDAKVWGEDWEFGRLRILDVASRKVETVFKQDAHVVDFDWSDDGRKVAVHVYKTPLMDDVFGGAGISIVDLQNHTTAHVHRTGSNISNLTWCGKWLWWAGQSDDRTLQSSKALFRIEAENSDAQVEKIGYGESNCAMALSKHAGKLIVYVQDGLHDSLEIIGSNTIFKEEIDISRGWVVHAEDSKQAIVLIKAQDTAMPLEIFSIVDGKQSQLSNHGIRLTQCQLGTASSITCRAQDGLELQGVLITPSKGKGPYPTVLTPHGGPYSRVTRGSDPMFNFPEWFLSLGYAVVLPNYRGGSGRGEKFAQAVIGNVGVSHSDCIDLLKKAITTGAVNKDKVAVAGWSQGGFLSFLAPTQDQFHFVAAIPGAGVSNWETMSMTSDLPAWEGILAGTNPWLQSPDDTQSRKWSAIFHMQNIKTPYLIIHGENDARVPVEQAVGFHRGMLARGKECEMVIYPLEGHGYHV